MTALLGRAAWWPGAAAGGRSDRSSTSWPSRVAGAAHGSTDRPRVTPPARRPRRARAGSVVACALPGPGWCGTRWAAWSSLGAVAFVAFGLPLLDRSLPRAGRWRPASRTPSAVRSPSFRRPAPTSTSAETRPGADRGTALFVVDGRPARRGRLAVPGQPRRRRAAAAQEDHQHRPGTRSTGPEQEIRTDQGRGRAAGAPTRSPGRPGRVRRLRGRGHASVEVTASGGEQDAARRCRGALVGLPGNG